VLGSIAPDACMVLFGGGAVATGPGAFPWAAVRLTRHDPVGQDSLWQLGQELGQPSERMQGDRIEDRDEPAALPSEGRTHETPWYQPVEACLTDAGQTAGLVESSATEAWLSQGGQGEVQALAVAAMALIMVGHQKFPAQEKTHRALALR